MPREITDYTLVRAGDIQDLSLYVENRIKKGWQPLGPAAPAVTPGGTWYHQTMVKYAPEVIEVTDVTELTDMENKS